MIVIFLLYFSNLGDTFYTGLWILAYYRHNIVFQTFMEHLDT